MHLKRLSSSSSHSMKMKTLFNYIITHSLYRVLRSISRTRSVFIEICKHNKKRLVMMIMMFYTTTKSFINNNHNIFFGSSSHVVPTAKPLPLSLHGEEGEDSRESKYVEWLEEKVNDDDHNVDIDINLLADMFIASCHERFLLEKVESCRRYQEMLARSL
ncbi:unnamed protein product [Cochlearia groenlandica]